MRPSARLFPTHFSHSFFLFIFLFIFPVYFSCLFFLLIFPGPHPSRSPSFAPRTRTNQCVNDSHFPFVPPMSDYGCPVCCAGCQTYLSFFSFFFFGNWQVLCFEPAHAQDRQRQAIPLVASTCRTCRQLMILFTVLFVRNAFHFCKCSMEYSIRIYVLILLLGSRFSFSLAVSSALLA